MINTEIMWLNSHIKVDRRPICNKECIDSNLWRLEQLYEQNDLLDCNLINIIYDVNLTQMQYNSLISAIPQHWRKHMKNVDSIKKHEKLIINIIPS